MSNSPSWRTVPGPLTPRLANTLLSLPKSGPIYVRIVGDGFELETHWHEPPGQPHGVTVPHLAPYCLFCVQGDPRGKHVYWPVLRSIHQQRPNLPAGQAWIPQALDLAQESAAELQTFLMASMVTSRHVLQLERNRRRGQPPIRYEIVEELEDKPAATFDPRPVVENVMRRWYSAAKATTPSQQQLADQAEEDRTKAHAAWMQLRNAAAEKKRKQA
jgi:hypothetical protein